MHVLPSPWMLKPTKGHSIINCATVTQIQKGKKHAIFLTQEPQHGDKVSLCWKANHRAENDGQMGFLVEAATRPCPWFLHTIHLPVKESQCTLHVPESEKKQEGTNTWQYY